MVVMTTRARTVVLVVALALAASLLTLAVVLAKPVQAQADTSKQIVRDSFDFITGSCPPESEPVLIDGDLLIVAHTTIDANGGFHTQFHGTLKGQGEGLVSGDKYVYHDTFNFHQNSPTGAELNFTQTQNFKIIRQGSATTTDDAQGRAVFHITVNANGEVTAFVENFEFVCT